MLNENVKILKSTGSRVSEAKYTIPYPESQEIKAFNEKRARGLKLNSNGLRVF